jgi:hypothetical protein
MLAELNFHLYVKDLMYMTYLLLNITVIYLGLTCYQAEGFGNWFIAELYQRMSELMLKAITRSRRILIHIGLKWYMS